jgi:hypothetical protein
LDLCLHPDVVNRHKQVCTVLHLSPMASAPRSHFS